MENDNTKLKDSTFTSSVDEASLVQAYMNIISLLSFHYVMSLIPDKFEAQNIKNAVHQQWLIACQIGFSKDLANLDPNFVTPEIVAQIKEYHATIQKRAEEHINNLNKSI